MEKEEIKKVIDLIARGELIEPLKIINTKYQDLLVSRTIFGAIQNEINLCKDLCNYCNKDCKQGKIHDCSQFDTNSEFVDIIINNIKNDSSVQAVFKNRRVEGKFKENLIEDFLIKEIDNLNNLFVILSETGPEQSTELNNQFENVKIDKSNSSEK